MRVSYRALFASYAASLLLINAGPKPALADTPAAALQVPVNAWVTRTVNGATVRLPAAFVPKLHSADRIDVDFRDFDLRHGKNTWQYHEDAVFVTGVGHADFVYAKGSKVDSQADAIYEGADPKVLTISAYDPKTIGTPIFFLIPDNRAGGDDGGAHTYISDNLDGFLAGQAANSAAVGPKSSLAAAVLSGLSSSAINVAPSGQSNVIALITSAGGDGSAAAKCYSGTPPPPKEKVTSCLEASLLTGFSTNGNPLRNGTAGQILGQVAGQAFSHLSPYLLAAGFLFEIFSKPHANTATGYEFLNGSPMYSPPDGTSYVQGGYGTVAIPKAFKAGKDITGVDRTPMDVVFFTLANQADDTPPAVALEPNAGQGVCATGGVVNLQLKLSPPPGATAIVPQYLHDMELRSSLQGFKSIPIQSDQTVGDIVVPRKAIDQLGALTYSLSFSGFYGFSDISSHANVTVAIAGKGAPWFPDSRSDRLSAGAQNVNYILRSDAAPCLQNAEVYQVGAGSQHITVSPTHLDAQHVQLTFSLTGFTPGIETVLLLHELPDSNSANLDVTDRGHLSIGSSLPSAAAATMSAGDGSILISGSNLWNASSIVVNPLLYFDRDLSDPVSSNSSSCFNARNQAAVQGISPNQNIAASFLLPGNAKNFTIGPSFSIAVAKGRPTLGPPTSKSITSDGQFVLPSGLFYSAADTLALTLPPLAQLPGGTSIWIRQAARGESRCATLDASRALSSAGVQQVPSAQILAVPQAVIATFQPAKMLGQNSSFGSLQVAISDAAKTLMSDWQSIPGTFVREPVISTIDCSGAPTSNCKIVGNSLELISRVSDGKSNTASLGTNCAPPQPSLSCMEIPRYDKYLFELADLPGYWLAQKMPPKP